MHACVFRIRSKEEANKTDSTAALLKYQVTWTHHMYNVVLAIHVGTRWRLGHSGVALHYGSVLGKNFARVYCATL